MCIIQSLSSYLYILGSFVQVNEYKHERHVKYSRYEISSAHKMQRLSTKFGIVICRRVWNGIFVAKSFMESHQGISVLDSGNIKREFSRRIRNKGRSRVSVPDCSPAYLPASTGIVKSGTDILNCTLQWVQWSARSNAADIFDSCSQSLVFFIFAFHA